MELLELLEELERKVLGGKQYFFMKKYESVVNKQEVLDILEALHRLIDEKYQALKGKMSVTPDVAESPKLKALQSDPAFPPGDEGEDARDIIREAKKEALEIKQEMDIYAENVLENIKLTVTKFKRKLNKLDEVIDMSRERLKQTAYYAPPEEEDEFES